MEAIAQTFDIVEPAQSRSCTIKTNLYELIGAIDDELQPGSDETVVETVLDLFDTGRITFLNRASIRRLTRHM